jgi:predicted transcriptional regulator of viral defense system
MKAVDAYSRLRRLAPVVTTSETAAALNMSPTAAAHALERLASAGLVQSVRHGIWYVGPGPIDPLAVLPVFTRPYPSYMSVWSALFDHGMIDQIPRAFYAVSMGRTKKVRATGATFEIHHICPALFDGYSGSTGTRAGVATPEKAIFDTVYLLASRSTDVSLPELELPDDFDASAVWAWVELIEGRRLQTIVSRQLRRLFASSADVHE